VNLADIDWGILRGALIAMAVSVAVSGTLIGTSYYFWEKVDKSHSRALIELRQVRDRFYKVDEEEEMIATYLPRYEDLEVEGIIGREHRLDWIESLREASQRKRLPALSFVIDSQEPFEPEFPLAQSDVFRVYTSDMQLDMGLLHEGDLIALLRELERDAKGLFSVVSCRMRRMVEEVVPEPDPTKAHISSSCSLRWYTIRKPGEEGAAS